MWSTASRRRLLLLLCPRQSHLPRYQCSQPNPRPRMRPLSLPLSLPRHRRLPLRLLQRPPSLVRAAPLVHSQPRSRPPFPSGSPWSPGAATQCTSSETCGRQTNSSISTALCHQLPCRSSSHNSHSPGPNSRGSRGSRGIAPRVLEGRQAEVCPLRPLRFSMLAREQLVAGGEEEEAAERSLMPATATTGHSQRRLPLLQHQYQHQHHSPPLCRFESLTQRRLVRSSCSLGSSPKLAATQP
jgi:hypothetical protein